MNLTLESLQDVHETISALERIDAVQQQSDLYNEIRDLGERTQNCLNLINELNVCVESLNSAGYSKEWFDIVNAEGNFPTVVDLDLPKFFGGDEAKQVACEGAIWDTIKRWVETVCKWITELIKKIVGWISNFNRFWFRTGKQDVEFVSQLREKSIELSKYALDPQVLQEYPSIKLALTRAYGEYKCYDANIIHSYISSVEKFLAILFMPQKGAFEEIKEMVKVSKDIIPPTAENQLPAGGETNSKQVLPSHIFQLIIRHCDTFNFSPTIPLCGFELNPDSGVEFVDVQAIPTIEFSTFDQKSFNEFAENAKMLDASSKVFDRIVNVKRTAEKVLTDMRTSAEEAKKRAIQSAKDKNTTADTRNWCITLGYIDEFLRIVAKTYSFANKINAILLQQNSNNKRLFQQLNELGNDVLAQKKQKK